MTSNSLYKRPLIKVLPVLLSLCYFGGGYGWLTQFHPQEDAFILFTYVENLAEGQGVSFYPGGGAAEGATDFLWLILLSGLSYLGLNVAVGAVLLNALGVGIISFLFSEIVIRSGRGDRLDLIFLLLMNLFLLISPVFTAAVAGFSVYLFSALVALTYYGYIYWPSNRIHWIPLLALATGLFRPDGLIVGSVFTVLAFFRSIEENTFRAFLRTFGVAFILGLSYFFWRLWYFGHWLPLPLIVKSIGLRHVATYAGWYVNSIWFFEIGLGLSVLLFVLICLLYRKDRFSQLKRILLGLLPLLFLMIALTFSVQSQNVAFRFQAPVFVVLLLAILSLLMQAISGVQKQHKRLLLLFATIFACIPVMMFGFLSLSRLRSGQGTYADLFPALIAEELSPDETIVLTEAGRFSYWIRTKIIDAVGLNTPEIAHFPISNKYLDQHRPFLIFFNQAGTWNESLLSSKRPEQQITSVKPEQLSDLVKEEYQTLFREGLKDYSNSIYPTTKVAPVLLTRYLAQSTAYEIRVVNYRGRYVHVVAVRKNYPKIEIVWNLLQQSIETPSIPSYLDLVQRRDH